ncbi:hypothetical protein DACRYDRAFT_104671 [Dacryopinax primogenitus]|uniref:Uncharacterized protein n=1 Tax=Dacryopinax primogenitus (strain DJM 731) TaxID=1858805 RepID=M5GG35_DACPD|nr:uncharacterized protein DACRYDRAFT_104671 [Dacryopinax primogenitus]EJU04798.1 hypothetical protein DACRYDRAFT_104671 [Dacryopinax primogenitus]
MPGILSPVDIGLEIEVRMPRPMRKKRRPHKRAPPIWSFPPSIPRSPTTSTPELEALIAHMLLLRYEQDIARLFSVHVDAIARRLLPKILERLTLTAAGPGWCAVHARDEGVRDFFRGVLAMDLRQAGERVAPRSLEWSYTSLRHFALSNDIHICESGEHGLQSYRLLPHLSALQAYVKSLHYQPAPAFTPPAFKGDYSAMPFIERLRKILEPLGELAGEKGLGAGSDTEGRSIWEPFPPWIGWESKAELGYARMVDTLWSVAREFDPRGYGVVLKQKLSNWCDCGCSTEHLGEVCERTVREDLAQRLKAEGKEGLDTRHVHTHEHAHVHKDDGECGGTWMPRREKGKGKEWDGRGGGILGWGTTDEEDTWDKTLDLGGIEDSDDWEDQMTMGEQMEWRYLKAEREKELGNAAYKLGKYATAINYYLSADTIEPELPHYKLNAAQAYLQLADWLSAERLCTSCLKQHPCSVKALWRRAKARRMQGKHQGSARDLRTLLTVQPGNREAMEALEALRPALEKKDPHGALCPGCLGSCTHASTSAAASSLTLASDQTAGKREQDDVPFEMDEFDRTRLTLVTVPVSLVMPDTGMEESFAYPSWERYRVERLD